MPKSSTALLETVHKALRRDPPPNVIRSLLKGIPDAVFHREAGTGMLPIHVCAMFSKKSGENIKIVLDAYSSGVNVFDNGKDYIIFISWLICSFAHQSSIFLEGRLPIHLACEYDAHASAIDILVAADPQTLYVHDPNTYTALDFLKSRPDVSLSSQKESETASQMSYDFSILTPGYSSGNKVRSEDSFRKIWNSTKTSTLPNVNRTCSFSTLSSNSSFPERSSFSCTEETGESSHSREEEECIEVGLVGGSDHIVAEDKDTESLRISRYWRDIIHGSFTGLLGAFALVTLFAGESLTVNETFIYGMTGTLAGSFLVGVSEFLATKSQNFVNFEKVKAEASLIRVNKEEEIFKLHRLFDKIGISDIKLQNLLTQFYVSKCLLSIKIYFLLVDFEN